MLNGRIDAVFLHGHRWLIQVPGRPICTYAQAVFDVGERTLEISGESAAAFLDREHGARLREMAVRRACELLLARGGDMLHRSAPPAFPWIVGGNVVRISMAEPRDFAPQP